MGWRRFLRLRPWFRLTSTEGDKINGQVMKDNGLELQIITGWSELRLKLSEPEAKHLLVWLARTYRKGSDDSHMAAVVPISRGKGDTGPSTG